MSADFSTTIKFVGTKENIEKGLQVLEKYIDSKKPVHFDVFLV